MPDAAARATACRAIAPDDVGGAETGLARGPIPRPLTKAASTGRTAPP
jgi:hypothetical protein